MYKYYLISTLGAKRQKRIESSIISASSSVGFWSYDFRFEEAKIVLKGFEAISTVSYWFAKSPKK
jgi:hypothetical protein